MREKYFIKKREEKGMGKGRFAFGIRYDDKKEKLYAAGPRVFSDEAEEIIDMRFGFGEKSEMKICGTRVSWEVSILRETWEKELPQFKKDFKLLRTRTFRRLTR